MPMKPTHKFYAAQSVAMKYRPKDRPDMQNRYELYRFLHHKGYLWDVENREWVKLGKVSKEPYAPYPAPQPKLVYRDNPNEQIPAVYAKVVFHYHPTEE